MAQRQGTDHVIHEYPGINEAELFSVIETDAGWYFSARVLNELDGGSLGRGTNEGVADADSNAALGYIYLGVSKSSIYASRKNIFIRNFGVSIVAGIILLSLMYIVLRNITRPLEKLSELMEMGRQGEYPEKTHVRGTKEVSDISHVFNEMIFAIKEREQNLSLTLDSIGDAVIVTDAEGCVVRMNPVAETLTGWALQEAKGRSVKDIFPIIDATTREPIKSPVDKVLESGETLYLGDHTTLIAKDKTEYQIADSAAPIRNEAGEILGMVLVFNDVTEQYQLRELVSRSERDMQAMMNNYPAIIYVRDKSGRITFINKQFEDIFNIKSEEIVGKTLDEAFSEDVVDGTKDKVTGKATAEIIKQMMSHDEDVLKATHALQFEEEAILSGYLHKYLSINFPLFDEDKNIYAICGISTDITEHKKQEEQLRRSQKMDALGKLTGGVAHDYNNMLGVVIGYAQILESQLQESPKHKNYAQKILHAGERGAMLTKKLLAFSSQKKVSADAVNINALLHEERDMLEKVITARIILQLDLAENLYSVYLDVWDLEDAIVNLSINAMHAIKDNGQLTIATSNQTISEMDSKLLQIEPGSYVRLSMTDNGCGMDDETKDKIFEPFYTTKGSKGTGLGLTQVYGFVERSGGAIQIYSELGQGTEFVMYFPAREEEAGRKEDKNKNSAENYKGYESILIVDDESALLELTCEVLNQQGYRTLCASSAAQALKLLESESIDLLLSDIIMPGMNGYQLAAMVKKDYPEIKVQLASGFSDSRHAEMVDDELHANMIQKPYKSTDLLKRVHDILAD